MTKKLYEETDIQNIANAIRIKKPTVSKNLYNTNSSLNLEGSIGTGNLAYPYAMGSPRKSYFMAVKSTTSYTISATQFGGRLYVFEFDRELTESEIIEAYNKGVEGTLSTLVANRYILSSSNPSPTKTYTFKTSSTCKFIGVYYQLDKVVEKFQIEEGTEATEYEDPNNLPITKYKVSEMATAISNIPTGGNTPTGKIDITENGTYDVTGYASANVNVSDGGSTNKITPTNITFYNSTSTGEFNDENIDWSLMQDVQSPTFQNSLYSKIILKNLTKTRFLNEIQNITNNGQYNFKECSNLEEVDLRNLECNNDYDTWIGTFYNCTNLKIIHLDKYDFSNTVFSTVRTSGTFRYCGTNNTEPTKIYVKDATAQQKILGASFIPSNWTTSNIIVAGSAYDSRNT